MTYDTQRWNPDWWLENGPHTDERIKEANAVLQETGDSSEFLRRLRLNEREAVFTQHVNNNGIKLHGGQYAIYWQENPDEPAKVTRPSNTWLAMARNGGILPPVWVYEALREDEQSDDFVTHTKRGNRVGRGYLLHAAEPMPAMTEEEAMQYLAVKVLPRGVIERGDFKIGTLDAMPADRKWRNAWRLRTDATKEIAA